VSDLLSVDGKNWDVEALENDLLHMDAQAVKRIPLGRGQDDFWAWSGERHGLYSVRSAYRLLVEQETLGTMGKVGLPILGPATTTIGASSGNAKFHQK